MTARLAPRFLALAALALCLAMLAAGSSTLPSPPSDPRTLPAWWSSTDPALALGALLRLVAGALCAWLLLVTAVELLATITGRARTARLVGSFAPAVWRTLVLRPVAAGTLAVPVLMSPVIALAPPAAASSTTVVDDPSAPSDIGPAVLTMTLCEEDHEHHHAEEPRPTTSTTTPASSTTSTTAPTSTTSTTTPAPVDPPPTTTAPPTTAAPPPTTTSTTTIHPEDLHDHTMIPPAPLDHLRPTDPSPPPTAGTPDLHVVVPGDSFWRIAAQRVEAHLGRPPSAREVATYWKVLVEANADRLAVPGNPDLIFPGDEVVLPPL